MGPVRLALAGINHRSAPVTLREKLAVGDERLSHVLASLRNGGARESMVLSTCNRVEITVLLEPEIGADQLLERILAGESGVPPDEIRPHIYTFEEREAIRHLFRVAASLDSMIVGEPQILGQLKQAFQKAKEQGAAGAVLESLLSNAFSVAKRVRSETEIGQSAVSVGYAAVELAREIFGSLKGKRVLVIGAGKMSENAARHLLRAGSTSILIANRTLSRARDLAAVLHGEVLPYEHLPQRLHEVDIVLASSGATGHVLQAPVVIAAIEARKNRPMFLIDIAVPRNIDPEVNSIEHAFLYDLDDLQRLAERNLQARVEVARAAEAMVSEEVMRLESRLRSRDVSPTIIGLQQELETIRLETLERFRPKLGGLSLAQEQSLDSLTRALVNRIAHGPISEIRRHATAEPDGAAGDSNEVLSAVRRMFRLRER